MRRNMRRLLYSLVGFLGTLIILNQYIEDTAIILILSIIVGAIAYKLA